MVIKSQINQITRDVIVTHRNKRYLAKQRGVNYGRATTARCQMRSLTLFSGRNYKYGLFEDSRDESLSLRVLD